MKEKFQPFSKEEESTNPLKKINLIIKEFKQKCVDSNSTTESKIVLISDNGHSLMPDLPTSKENITENSFAKFLVKNLIQTIDNSGEEKINSVLELSFIQGKLIKDENERKIREQELKSGKFSLEAPKDVDEEEYMVAVINKKSKIDIFIYDLIKVEGAMVISPKPIVKEKNNYSNDLVFNYFK